jgi:hypothetical protein
VVPIRLVVPVAPLDEAAARPFPPSGTVGHLALVAGPWQRGPGNLGRNDRRTAVRREQSAALKRSSNCPSYSNLFLALRSAEVVGIMRIWRVSTALRPDSLVMKRSGVQFSSRAPTARSKGFWGSTARNRSTTGWSRSMTRFVVRQMTTRCSVRVGTVSSQATAETTDCKLAFPHWSRSWVAQ